MNRTKKRAHKRALFRVKHTTFKWPYPLTHEFKIKNLKAYREHYHIGLAEAKDIVEMHMRLQRPRPQRPLINEPVF